MKTHLFETAASHLLRSEGGLSPRDILIDTKSCNHLSLLFDGRAGEKAEFSVFYSLNAQKKKIKKIKTRYRQDLTSWMVVEHLLIIEDLKGTGSWSVVKSSASTTSSFTELIQGNLCPPRNFFCPCSRFASFSSSKLINFLLSAWLRARRLTIVNIYKN